MELSSSTSNIQPYGSLSGTQIAKEETKNSEITTNKPSSAQGQPKEISKVDTSKQIAEMQQELNQQQREQMVEEMNEFISSLNKGLSFRVDEESGKNVVTIYEVSSGEVIRQFPDAAMLEVYRNLANGGSSLLIDKV
ncbi:flagellar protein FlaG [Vibrio maerlii]|uniref:flagellar protein FlaG n=1 Tax=Vibrio maerlii TaxID=2231648 RepID=UPI000E3DEDD6|nr:flagellar protein FlaG [Vibrio maerlii]